MAPILEDKEYPRYANDDEAKSESDVHEVASVAVELDVFDSDNFMEVIQGRMRATEDVMPDNESWPQVVQGVEDVADAGSNEDNSARENLGMTDEEVCDIAE
ncbi:hypothetical protein PC117_g5983 [Phytophthora cactorum]|uniref:Uncharacterized protein n=1 Tax=Phytophthora cactorum TaxID=29920 RepID=A0A8T1E4R5_9STRA|nr:hypothetical protein PC117_g5983 [Phytophthora cactorum]